MKPPPKTLSGRPTEPTKLTTAIPVRLTRQQQAELRQLKESTGLPISNIMRIGFDYFLPRFLSGEVNILKCGRSKP